MARSPRAAFDGMGTMSCPHLKEVVMLFCDAYPVKKMLPLDRIATAHPCLGQDYEKCPLFCELMARLNGEDVEPVESGSEKTGRESCHVARILAHTRDAGAPRAPRH